MPQELTELERAVMRSCSNRGRGHELGEMALDMRNLAVSEHQVEATAKRLVGQGKLEVVSGKGSERLYCMAAGQEIPE